jgi:prepilin-type processing-associated H-X9-DG protein
VSRLALLCLALSVVGWAPLIWFAEMAPYSAAVWAAAVLFLLALFVTEVYCLARVLRRRQEGVLYLLVAFLFTVGPCASMGDPPDRQHAEYAAASNCRSNIHNVWLSVQHYMNAHNDELPTPQRWCDVLKEEELLDDGTILRCTRSRLDCGFALNEAAGARRPWPSYDTVLLFESDAGWNAAGGRELLAYEPRHAGGYNFVFCDGSIRWVRAEDVDSLRWGP